MSGHHHMSSRRTKFKRTESPSKSCSIGITVDSLERLLCETLVEYCTDPKLVQKTKFHFTGLAKRRCSNNNNQALSYVDIEQVIEHLLLMLDLSPSLPRSDVANVHTHIGFLKHLQKNYECAIFYFTKALWIEHAIADELSNAEYRSSSKGSSMKDKNMTAAAIHQRCCDESLQVALTLHRLAISYRHNGEYNQALTVIEKAITIYKKLLKDDHKFMVDAKKELDHDRHLLLTSMAAASSSSNNSRKSALFMSYAGGSRSNTNAHHCRKILPCIQEEEEQRSTRRSSHLSVSSNISSASAA